MPFSDYSALGLAHSILSNKVSSDSSGSVQPSKEQIALSNANIFDAIGNLFTGNLDAQRSVSNAIQAQRFNAEEASKARKFSSEEAEKSRAFNAEEALKAFNREKDLYSKRYQIQVEDLKKAGLNPALAYNIGAGTLSSPSASSTPAVSSSASGGSAYSSSAGRGFSDMAKLLNSAFRATNAVAFAEASKNYSSASSMATFLKLLTALAIK